VISIEYYLINKYLIINTLLLDLLNIYTIIF